MAYASLVQPVGVGAVLESRYRLAQHVGQERSCSSFACVEVTSGGAAEALVLPPRAPDAERVRFSEVAQRLSTIDHPHCAKVLCFGSLADGTMYLVRREVGPTRLRQQMQTPWPARLVASMAAQLLSALEHLAARGIAVECVSPSHLAVRGRGDDVSLFVVDFPHCSDPEGAWLGLPIPDEDRRYAHPRLGSGVTPEVAVMHSVGVLLGELLSPTEEAGEAAGRELLESLRGALLHPASDFSLRDAARTAAAAERSFTSASTSAWNWPASAPSSEELPATASGVLLRTPIAELAPPPPKARSRHTLAFALTGAAAALVVAAVALVVAPSEEGSAAVVGTPARVATRLSPEPRERPEPTVEDAAVEVQEELELADPIAALAAINESDLERVLPFGPRHVLLERLAARPTLWQRVDLEWNAVLDLVQAPQSTTPCAVFRRALLELEAHTLTPERTAALVGIAVPSPSNLDGAGVFPDESCDGLGAAFARQFERAAPGRPAARRAAALRPRTRAHTKAPGHAGRPKTVAQVATPLGDDLKAMQ